MISSPSKDWDKEEKQKDSIFEIYDKMKNNKKFMSAFGKGLRLYRAHKKPGCHIIKLYIAQIVKAEGYSTFEEAVTAAENSNFTIQHLSCTSCGWEYKAKKSWRFWKNE